MTGKTLAFISPFAALLVAGMWITSADAQYSGPQLPKRPASYQIAGKTYYPLPSVQDFEEEGVASWYGPDFHGRQTSCGEIYDMHGLTAAHKTLPMNTWLLIRNLENDRVVTVRVNDRGPFYEGRIVDLTRAAADSLGFLDRGTTRVRITVLAEPENLAAIRQGDQPEFENHPGFSEW